ncbi:asparagine synthetase B [Bacteroidota bacterium]|nr:asparagine synthetase B [Bacteroidota bacterium]
MCGIAGYYSIQPFSDEVALKKMTDAIAHRGPDSDGFFFDEHCGLGHRRLSIIDLSSAANQPMYSHNSRYVMVFNGEIFNFQEIASQVTTDLKTHSDSEVILELLSQKGAEAVNLFNGMFTIALYDKQEKSLTVFRDRLGVKPIYYSFQNGKFVFASELKALLQFPDFKNNLKKNQKAIAQYLNIGYIAEPDTIYEGIYKFPSGSYAKIGATGIKFSTYWKAEEKIESVTVNDFATAKNQLNNLMRSSVQLRMISDVPFGTFLSGGIDSSLVTAIAQSVSAEPVKTFSIGFNDAGFNESEYAKKISRHLHTEHYEFIVTYNEAIELADKIIDQYDEPYADSSAIPTMLVSKLARQHVTMTLSGDGGDELFMGYGAYKWAERLQNPLLQTFRKPLSGMLTMLPSKYKRVAALLNYSDKQFLPSHIFSQEQYFFSADEIENILVNKPNDEYRIAQNISSLKRNLSVKEAQALFDLNYYLKDDLLVKVDQASMKYSLETRTPFLDYRVVEFALNLNENLKLKNGTAKYLLKEVLYDYVPREYFDRPKQGFAIPLKHWLKKELKHLVDFYLSKEMVEQHAVINFPEVKKLLQRFNAGEEYLYNRIWTLIILQQWLEKEKHN